MENLKIIMPKNKDEAEKYIYSYYEASKEYEKRDIDLYAFHDTSKFHIWKDSIYDDFQLESQGIYGEQEYVPSSTYWLVNEKEFIGSGIIRHELNENLELLGGHIGYGIRPKYWDKGYATLFLTGLLKRANEMGINPVVITCDEFNRASSKVIENNGGEFFDVNNLLVDGKKRRICRYIVRTDVESDL